MVRGERICGLLADPGAASGWCSGSGKLSLIALLSRLCVLFPIGYRYGWDLSHPEHQRIIQEIEHDICGGLEVLIATPTCRPWSISSTRRDLEMI